MSDELKPVAQIMGLADDYADARADETLITERGGVHLDPDSNDARAKLMLAVSALQSRIADLEAKAKLPEALHTFLNAAGVEGLVLDGVDAGDLYEQLFPERYQEQTEKAFGSWEPAVDAAIAAKEHPHG